MTAETPHDFVVDMTIALAQADMHVSEIVAPTDCNVVLRNRRFHYLDWKGHGRIPLILLHGRGLTAHTWDLVCLALRSRYQCYALDLRGHGDSEWATDMDYSIQAHAADVDALVRNLDLNQPILIGMSLGGAIAVRYAIDHASRAVVVIDSGPGIDVRAAESITAFMRQQAELDSVDDFVARALAFNPRRDRRLLRRSLLHNLVQLPDGKWTWKYDRRHFGRVSAESAQDEREALWDASIHVACPTLIVRGAESPVFSRQNAEAFALRLPAAAWVEIPGAGHTVQGDNPKALVDAIFKFLEQTTM